MSTDTANLTKVSANCVPATIRALDHAATLTGDNHTDTINRAIQVYAALIDAHAKGYEIKMSRQQRRCLGGLVSLVETVAFDIDWTTADRQPATTAKAEG